jgi:tetratricopeptide (TPR) repeat protein
MGERLRAYTVSIPLWWRNWRTLPVRSWARGAAAYRKGNFALAIDEYETGLAHYTHHPARFSARLDLAFCYFKNKDFNAAEKNLRFVISSRPEIKEGYLRLARVQMWIGHKLDAAWTMRRASSRVKGDPTIAALFLLGVLESKAPPFLLEEAVRYADQVQEHSSDDLLLRVAQARFLMIRGIKEPAREMFAELVRVTNCPIEAFLYYAELLLNEGEIALGTDILKRALHASPSHPEVLASIASTYLLPGENYSPTYAVQLATIACQETSWQSPHQMHILARAYLAQDDRNAALIVAEKARVTGESLLGNYADIRGIARLIHQLSRASEVYQES